jgi:hypothetical protein
MKVFYIFLLLCANSHTMIKSKSTKRAPLSPLEQLSADLKIAIRDLDLPKTQAALKKINELNKKAEELQCLETEITPLVRALQFHYEKVSEGVAQLAAQAAIERYTTPQTKNPIFPNACQAAFIDHGKAIAIQDVVTNFFIKRWRSESECTFSLTPPPPAIP